LRVEACRLDSALAIGAHDIDEAEMSHAARGHRAGGKLPR